MLANSVKYHAQPGERRWPPSAPAKFTYVCIPCRFVSKDREICQTCGNEMKCMGKRWCAPKKNNNRAWKRIERGEYLWDRRRVRRGDHSSYFIKLKGHKKGQFGTRTSSYLEKPTLVDMGG